MVRIPFRFQLGTAAGLAAFVLAAVVLGIWQMAPGLAIVVVVAMWFVPIACGPPRYPTH